jgi:hypothetical protein
VGYCSAVTRDGWRWIVDAHREGRRYIVHSDELLSAFLELEATLLPGEQQIEALTATVRKVSERVELSAPAPQMAANED